MRVDIDKNKQPSVLIVDDDQAICNLIKRNLEKQGMHVLEAFNGFDCVRILHESLVDLIVLDVQLPDFSGWGILGLLRFTEPLRHIPVIIVSAADPPHQLVALLHPDDYIRKPFDVRELVLRISKCSGFWSVN